MGAHADDVDPALAKLIEDRAERCGWIIDVVREPCCQQIHMQADFVAVGLKLPAFDQEPIILPVRVGMQQKIRGANAAGMLVMRHFQREVKTVIDIVPKTDRVGNVRLTMQLPHRHGAAEVIQVSKKLGLQCHDGWFIIGVMQ
jgi:hypothetical protein